VKEFAGLVAGESPAEVRREAMWMLSELSGGGAEEVAAVAALLASAELREDARMVLQRIPGEASLGALKAALASAPEDFKPAVAGALRARGVEVQGYPDQKLVPTKSTAVKPIGR
jgi:ethanolamine utilization microcompartment shell protein EutL